MESRRHGQTFLREPISKIYFTEIYKLLLYAYFVAVHGFKGSEVQGYVLVPGLYFGGVFM